jgi:hypothetical protein
MQASKRESLLSRAFKVRAVRRGAAFTLIALLVANFIYQNHLESVRHANEVERYKVAVADYYEYGKKCTKVDNLPKIDYASNPRSNARIATATNHFYAIFAANCLILDNNKIYKNPYKKFDFEIISTSPPGSVGNLVWLGLLYEIDRGVPFLRTGGTLCGDGWISGSSGRGTCSWHGGYARNRGTQFNFEGTSAIHDPRPMLKKLLRE